MLMTLTNMQFEDIEEAAIWWDGLQVNPIDKVNMVSCLLFFARGNMKSGSPIRYADATS